MKQVYKITNLKNMKSYIGISIPENQTHLDRFEKHMSGKGGIWIKKDLESGLALREDFVIEVLEEGNEPVEWYRNLEIYYIEYFDTLYPNGYNGNKGNYIILTPEVIQKSVEAKHARRAAGQHKRTGLLPGWSIYRYPTGELKWLPQDHNDIISGVAKHFKQCDESKSQKLLKEIQEQKERNNGYTDAQVAFFERMKVISRNYVNHPNWIQGRQKMRDRLARKEFTEAELDLHSNRRPLLVKESWASLPKEQRLARTSAGREIMNSRYTCEHCGIETNKGNYGRWHGQNCKHNKKQL